MISKTTTKAEVLENLLPALKTAKILPQIRFTVIELEVHQKEILDKVKARGFFGLPVIVRSSAAIEDKNNTSLAGHFKSVLNVLGEKQLISAVNEVIESFDIKNKNNQVFIQPMLEDITLSGVAFSKDQSSNAPYIVINYDDKSPIPNTVTSGSSNDLNTLYFYRYAMAKPPEPFNKIIDLICELEKLLLTDSIDIEFAFNKNNELFLLQARPLVVHTKSKLNKDIHIEAVDNICKKVKEAKERHPYLYGSRTVYGVMPDWNPAEIIGIKPRPLALSIYKEVITDNIWAYQRDNYGYRNLRSFPLLINFYGLPYIDVRVSFNSFIPRDVEDNLAEKLVNYYLDRLITTPSYHDKVEFEIIYSCYTLDLPQRLSSLYEAGFSKNDCEKLSNNLRNLTNKVIHGEKGLWKNDIEKIKQLEYRRETIINSSLNNIAKIYWLLEDCKRYGTLPFAGLARAGFIAVQLLRSLVNAGVLSNHDYSLFMNNLNTVSSKITKDFAVLDKKEFLAKYGHLRPGTYDILSPRYDEEPERYFDWTRKNAPSNKTQERFLLSLEQNNQIEQLLNLHGIEHNVTGLFDFIKAAIEGREYAKFVFTRNISDMLSLLKKVGAINGLHTDDCSFADISLVKELYSSSTNISLLLEKSIENGKRTYEITKQLILPALLIDEKDVWAFHIPSFEPNFITLKRTSGNVSFISDNKDSLQGNILFIQSADPGYDWIFSHNISGFITMYGGANSHMAIRAAELGMPAVIGAGESLYNKWSQGKTLEIDCANKLVRILK